jgi:hypothetical protein
MVFENAESTEIQASGTWTNQETCERSSHTGQPGGTGQDSRESRSEPFSPGGNDWKRRGFDHQSNGSSTGEIVEQLIDETRKELEVTELHANKLRERLSTLEGLSSQLPTDTK